MDSMIASLPNKAARIFYQSDHYQRTPRQLPSSQFIRFDDSFPYDWFITYETACPSLTSLPTEWRDEWTIGILHWLQYAEEGDQYPPPPIFNQQMRYFQRHTEIKSSPTIQLPSSDSFIACEIGLFSTRTMKPYVQIIHMGRLSWSIDRIHRTHSIQLLLSADSTDSGIYIDSQHCDGPASFPFPTACIYEYMRDDTANQFNFPSNTMTQLGLFSLSRAVSKGTELFMQYSSDNENLSDNWDHVKIGILQQLIKELLFLSETSPSSFPYNGVTACSSLSTLTFSNGDGTSIVENLRRLAVYVRDLQTTNSAILSPSDIQFLDDIRAGIDIGYLLPDRFHHVCGRHSSEVADLFTLLLSVVDGEFHDPAPAANTPITSLSFPHFLLHVTHLHHHFRYPSSSESCYERCSTMAVLNSMLYAKMFVQSAPTTSITTSTTTQGKHHLRHSTLHKSVNYVAPQLSADLLRTPASLPDPACRSNHRHTTTHPAYLELKRQTDDLALELKRQTDDLEQLNQLMMNQLKKEKERALIGHSFAASPSTDRLSTPTTNDNTPFDTGTYRWCMKG
jgi:hypothetical protein